MTFAPVDLLAHIVAAHTAHLCDLDTLTVQCASRWVLVAQSIKSLPSQHSRFFFIPLQIPLFLCNLDYIM